MKKLGAVFPWALLGIGASKAQASAYFQAIATDQMIFTPDRSEQCVYRTLYQ